jgi:hypothetical protein
MHVVKPGGLTSTCSSGWSNEIIASLDNISTETKHVPLEHRCRRSTIWDVIGGRPVQIMAAPAPRCRCSGRPPVTQAAPTYDVCLPFAPLSAPRLPSSTSESPRHWQPNNRRRRQGAYSTQTLPFPVGTTQNQRQQLRADQLARKYAPVIATGQSAPETMSTDNFSAIQKVLYVHPRR